MLVDTIFTAYERAKAAQFRGLHTIDVICDALNRTQKTQVTPFPGCTGFVRHRVLDEDEIPIMLIVRVDVADILIEARADYERSLQSPEQPKFRRQSKPRNIMMR